MKFFHTGDVHCICWYCVLHFEEIFRIFLLVFRGVGAYFQPLKKWVNTWREKAHMMFAQCRIVCKGTVFFFTYCMEPHPVKFVNCGGWICTAVPPSVPHQDLWNAWISLFIVVVLPDNRSGWQRPGHLRFSWFTASLISGSAQHQASQTAWSLSRIPAFCAREEARKEILLTAVPVLSSESDLL